jgi:hypothetical protein
MLSGIQIVDVDTHITEWYDLWTSRAPAGMKSRVPQVCRQDNGVMRRISEGPFHVGPLVAISRWSEDAAFAVRTL